jgi:hypothetical protein
MQRPLRLGTPVGAQDISFSAEQEECLFTIEHGIFVMGEASQCADEEVEDLFQRDANNNLDSVPHCRAEDYHARESGIRTSLRV